MSIDTKCPICGGDVERVEIRSNALRPGVMGRRPPTITYKCLSSPYIGHMPPNWKPGQEPAEDLS